MLRALRDTFKNSGIGRPAMAATVALPLLPVSFGPAANDAHAGDGQIRYVKTEPGDTEYFIRRLGGSASNGRFALVVFSDNNDVLRAAYEVAQEIENKTPHEVTFIHAPSIGPISRFLVAANGIEVLDAQSGGGDIAGLKKDLQSGFDQGGKQLASADHPKLKGKPVTLRVGPGFSLSAADGLAGILEKKGCPTTVTQDGFIPNSIDVEVNGEKPANFESPGSAGSFALDVCLAGTK